MDRAFPPLQGTAYKIIFGKEINPFRIFSQRKLKIFPDEPEKN